MIVSIRAELKLNVSLIVAAEYVQVPRSSPFDDVSVAVNAAPVILVVPLA